MPRPPLTKPVIRDHAWVEREYNREKYPLIHAAIQNIVAEGEKELNRLVGRACAAERGEIVLAMHTDAVINAQSLRVPTIFMAYGISGFVNEILSEACCADTDLIIELGAGWGRNLFNLYLTGAVKKTACLLALEFSERARAAGTLIASTAQFGNFSAHLFDYHAPDYHVVSYSDAPALVATIHSIEQIPLLKPDVFTKLLERRPNLTGVHLEPVSFQLPPEKRLLRDAWSSVDYAAFHDYNRNLWPLLQSLETQGLIEIMDVVPDVLGLNTANASTYITWRSRARRMV